MTLALVLLLVYAIGTSWALVLFVPRAAKASEFERELSESEHARKLEKEKYYADNSAWQKECERLKFMVRDRDHQLRDCRAQLHKES